MPITPLKSRRGQTLGTIDTLPSGHLRLKRGTTVLGYYQPEADQTLDARKRPVGSGNWLAALLGWDPLTQSDHPRSDGRDSETTQLGEAYVDLRRSMSNKDQIPS